MGKMYHFFFSRIISISFRASTFFTRCNCSKYNALASRFFSSNVDFLSEPSVKMAKHGMSGIFTLTSKTKVLLHNSTYFVPKYLIV